MWNFIIQKTFEDDNFLSIHHISHLEEWKEHFHFKFSGFAIRSWCGRKTLRNPSTVSVFWVYGLCHHLFHTWFGYKLFLIFFLIWFIHSQLLRWRSRLPNKLLCVQRIRFADGGKVGAVGNVFFGYFQLLHEFKEKIFEFFIKIHVNTNLHNI